MAQVVRSVSADQGEILDNIAALHLSGGWYECDVTYGNGAFWRGRREPELRFDKQALSPEVVESCSTALPLADGSLGSMVFDPPFLTYVREGRSGNGKMAMARRFAGYWAYSELEAHYTGTIREAGRVLRKDGVLVVKCQDIIHNHRMHCTHASVIEWAAAAGFRLLDLYVLVASHRMPSPNRVGVQKHARVFHSYFLVFKRLGR